MDVASTVPTFDWQGHRGCRGLYPENTIEGFLHALDFREVTTLELDLAVSKDLQLVVSHEPWMSDEICSYPDGKPIFKPDHLESYIAIYKLNYSDVKKFDCGSKGHPRFPDQIAMQTYKPTLSAVFEAVKDYCRANKRPFPKFNIEIKSMPQFDTIFTPPVDQFVALTLAEIKKYFPTNYLDLITLQSFDIRALEAIWALDQQITTAYLIENENDFQFNMSILSFVPKIYSPKYQLVTKQLLSLCKESNLKVIPWTVNDAETMYRLKKLGVDGIITDYPNLIGQVEAKLLLEQKN